MIWYVFKAAVYLPGDVVSIRDLAVILKAFIKYKKKIVRFMVDLIEFSEDRWETGF